MSTRLHCDHCGASRPDQKEAIGWFRVFSLGPHPFKEEPADFCSLLCLSTWSTKTDVEHSR